MFDSMLSAAFDVLIKILKSYRPQIPSDIVRYKDRLVAKDYVQKYDINYKEVFSSMARMETI